MQTGGQRGDEEERKRPAATETAPARSRGRTTEGRARAAGSRGGERPRPPGTSGSWWRGAGATRRTRARPRGRLVPRGGAAVSPVSGGGAVAPVPPAPLPAWRPAAAPAPSTKRTNAPDQPQAWARRVKLGLEDEGIARRARAATRSSRGRTGARSSPVPRGARATPGGAARRREEEVGKADRQGEKAEDPEGGVRAPRGFPGGRRGERDAREEGERREQQDGESEEREVDPLLRAGRRPADEEVRVRVAREEEKLEEEHAGGPDGGASSEPREDESRDERLDLEEEERGEEDRRGEERHRPGYDTGAGPSGGSRLASRRPRRASHLRSTLMRPIEPLLMEFDRARNPVPRRKPRCPSSLRNSPTGS